MAGWAALENMMSRMISRHISLAVRNDQELDKLLDCVTISKGGVFPNIQGVLFPKKTEKQN